MSNSERRRSLSTVRTPAPPAIPLPGLPPVPGTDRKARSQRASGRALIRAWTVRKPRFDIPVSYRLG